MKAGSQMTRISAGDYPVSGSVGVGLNKPGREASHSSPSSSHISTPSYVCVAWYLVKHNVALLYFTFTSRTVSWHEKLFKFFLYIKIK
jgi:hypothetical protein